MLVQWLATSKLPKMRVSLTTGISHEAIVQESKKYWQAMESNAHGAQVFFSDCPKQHTGLRKSRDWSQGLGCKSLGSILYISS